MTFLRIDMKTNTYQICGNGRDGKRIVLVNEYVGTRHQARAMARRQQRKGFGTWVEFGIRETYTSKPKKVVHKPRLKMPQYQVGSNWFRRLLTKLKDWE